MTSRKLYCGGLLTCATAAPTWCAQGIYSVELIFKIETWLAEKELNQEDFSHKLRRYGWTHEAPG